MSAAKRVARQAPPDVIDRLKAAVGPAGTVDDPVDMAPYCKSFRDDWEGRVPLVLKPQSTAQVAAVVRICAEAGVGIVPQGGNTGLTGGSVPHADMSEIVVSTSRMKQLRAIDTINDTITVEAGVVLKEIQNAAERADRLFPLSLGAEGSCQIGGNISTNAGGVQVLRYGNMRNLVLGLEVVLPDGSVWDGLRGLRKDNTGYDMKQVFIGAEGTLGIITAATLRLIPRPRSVETAFTGVASPEAALELLGIANEHSGGNITSFELMFRMGIDAVLKYDSGSRDPLNDKHEWYVLIELSSQQRTGLRDTMEEILAEGVEKGLVADAAIAESLDQTKAFWRIREMFGEVQRQIGGSIKHDISVPVAHVPAFIREANQAVAKLIPGARPLPFGHLGDGNIHYNIAQPVEADKAAFLERWHDVNMVVFDVVLKYGGSISAEHGIGIMKRDLLPTIKDPVAMELMRAIKRTLDPNGILNPGKVL
jgi:FAD/FMN-containing dehydrogenase